MIRICAKAFSRIRDSVCFTPATAVESWIRLVIRFATNLTGIIISLYWPKLKRLTPLLEADSARQFSGTRPKYLFFVDKSPEIRYNVWELMFCFVSKD